MNKRAIEALSVLTSGPLWVESPAVESGSVDPLGFQIEADRIAAELLPGVTVFTTRARYPSFLCWALSHYGDNTAEIDRWEIALSVGEYLRHRDDGLRCSYRGKQLLTSRDKSGRLNGSERLPTRLYKQTARGLYGGLLRSCALVDESEELSPLGQKITAEFERDLPRRRPAVIWACARNLPCLSELRAREKRWLWEALLESNEDTRKRLATLREVGGSCIIGSCIIGSHV